MLKAEGFVSGCWVEIPVARSTATLGPNVGLSAARDANQRPLFLKPGWR